MIQQRLVVSNKVKRTKNFNYHQYFVFIVCQNFLVHSDSGLAHRLQEEECRIDNYYNYSRFYLNIVAVHFDRNRTHRRESRLGVKTARDIEEEEKQAFVAKQFDFYQQKQKLLVFIFRFISI